jgi:hypothetical protein
VAARLARLRGLDPLGISVCGHRIGEGISLADWPPKSGRPGQTAGGGGARDHAKCKGGSIGGLGGKGAHGSGLAMASQIGGGEEVDGGMNKESSVGFFRPERDSGGHGYSLRCHLGRRGSDGCRRW